MKKHLKLLTVLLLFCSVFIQQAKAQACTSGCSNYDNYGYNSENYEDGTGNAAATLEYDNIISTYSSSIARDKYGNFLIWGHRTTSSVATGVAIAGNNFYVPTLVNNANFPEITGTPVKVVGAANSTDQVQHVMLTSDNKLYAWGYPGQLVNNNLAPYYPIQELKYQGVPLGLPQGVTAADVKMMFGTRNIIAITTCAGNVHVLSASSNVRGDGTNSGLSWSTVQKTDGTPLTGIVATRGNPNGLMALDQDGNIWVWGNRTRLGDNAADQHRNRATRMVLPPHSGTIKMIGSSNAGGVNNYYVLYEDGALWAMGYNQDRSLGTWNTTESIVWVQPRYPNAAGTGAGLPMNDIVWISPQEHTYNDGGQFINVINTNKELWNFGYNSIGQLARSIPSGAAGMNPGMAINFESGYSNAGITTVESGGRTSLILNECSGAFGITGTDYMGSFGNGKRAVNSGQNFGVNVNEYTFTNTLQVCGADNGDGVSINTSVTPGGGVFYQGQTITLTATPAGGTFTVNPGTDYDDVNNPYVSATLVGNQLTFNNIGNVRVDYIVTTPNCGTVTISRLFSVAAATSVITIPGTIWDDANADAVIDAGENGLSNNMWAVLTDPFGLVISTVKINDDGTYTFNVGTNYLTQSGNYSVILKNESTTPGAVVTTADIPANGYQYTGTNRGDTGNTSENQGTLNLGNLSTLTGGTTTAPANFGIKEGCTDSGITSLNLNSLFTGTLPHPDLILEWWTTPTRVSGTQVADPTNVTESGTYYAFFYDDENDCYNTDNSTSSVVVTILPPCACTQEPQDGTPDGYTKVGVSTMAEQAEGWPENIGNGFIAMESNTKGFVITRVAHVGGTDGTPDLVNDAIKDPKEGMLVYDIEDECVKLFNGTIWNCISQGCNDPAGLLVNYPEHIINGDLNGPEINFTITIPYINGDGRSYAEQKYPSTGITGLIATLPAGTLADGSGELTLHITGTISNGGTASFEIEFNGQTYTIVASLTYPAGEV